MSERLPVGATLNEAFQFALKRWFTVIRLGWAPMVIGLAIFFGAAYAMIDQSVLNFEVLESSDDPMMLFRFDEYLKIPPAMALIVMIGITMLMMLVISGFMASIYRLVALGEERSGILDLRFDGPAQRVFWAQVIVTIVNYAIFGLAFLAGLAITGQSPSSVFSSFAELFRLAAAAESAGTELDPNQLTSVVEPLAAFGVAIMLVIIPSIYINVKLIPFLPGSAAENRLLFMGSLSMTKGHFWSIVGIYLLLGLLMMLLSMIFGLASEIFEMITKLGLEQGSAFALVGAVSGLILAVATVLYQAFVVGLQLGIRGIIYRRLKTGV